MTVSYTGEVATCRGFGCFLKLLFRWKGSIYKLVWLDLTAFLTLYYTLSIVYRFGLSDEHKKTFEDLSKYCEKFSNYIPMAFVLGFYVSIVVQRWWAQFSSIPWPDNIAVFISASIQGQDERGRVMRRTIMRYTCLSLTMVFSMISPRVKKRFPSLEHFVEAGLLLENERCIMEDLNLKAPKYSKQWMPIVWAASIATRARREGRIRDDFSLKTILDELNKFRAQAGLLVAYDWISVPLVYTQVVTIAVYTYFLTCVMGRQWLESDATDRQFATDLYFPVFTTLQFFFYMGWLKVAESLVNPFGEDDDDFEVNWLVDRNLQVSYLIVDDMHYEHPELLKDQYWAKTFPVELPYTFASEREDPPAPSTEKIAVSKEDAEIDVPCDVVTQELIDGGGRVGSGKIRRRASKSIPVSISKSNSVVSIDSKMGKSSSKPSIFQSLTGLFKDKIGPQSISGSLQSRSSFLRPEGGSSIGHAWEKEHILYKDTIPEGDEQQATVVSMKKEPPRPKIQTIFNLSDSESDHETPLVPKIPQSEPASYDTAMTHLPAYLRLDSTTSQMSADILMQPMSAPGGINIEMHRARSPSEMYRARSPNEVRRTRSPRIVRPSHHEPPVPEEPNGNGPSEMNEKGDDVTGRKG